MGSVYVYAELDSLLMQRAPCSTGDPKRAAFNQHACNAEFYLNMKIEWRVQGVLSHYIGLIHGLAFFKSLCRTDPWFCLSACGLHAGEHLPQQCMMVWPSEQKHLKSN